MKPEEILQFVKGCLGTCITPNPELCRSNRFHYSFDTRPLIGKHTVVLAKDDHEAECKVYDILVETMKQKKGQ